MSLSGLLASIQASALGHFVRESSPWTYPVVNLAHILGIATLFGAVLVLDLTLLGVRRRLEMPAIVAAAAPIAAIGFSVAAVTGLGLLSANATEYQANPFFLIKFPVIALGATNALLVRRTTAWRAIGSRALEPSEARQLAWMGGVSLASWTTAIAAGRMIAYW